MRVFLGLILISGRAYFIWRYQDEIVAATDAMTNSLTDTTASSQTTFTDRFKSSLSTSYIEDSMSWTPPKEAAPYLALMAATEAANAIPKNLLARVLYQESRFRPDIITGKTKSSAGALGIAQFMPATAKDLGIDPLNPSEAIPAAGRYLKQLYLRFGNWYDAVASYNWGAGNVAKKGIAKAPKETKNYISQIFGDITII